MTSTAVRRTALAASAAALALLATACGGSSDDAGKSGDGKTAEAGGSASAAASADASAAPSTAAAKALTAAELQKAALTQADVKSGTMMEKLPAQDQVAQDKVKAGKAECAPLAQLQAGSYVGKPAATVSRKWIGDPKKPAAGASEEEKFLAGLNKSMVVLTLASYADGGAEKAMKELTTAATQCAGGFEFSVSGASTKDVKVVKTDAPQGADEALAVTMTMDAEGTRAPVKGVVVRKGATLAYLPAVNMASAASGDDFDFPAELVQAQLAKLG
ncbi:MULTISPECIES: hypothetical protein [unclassified Streptomyces]|uniref:hypothetical protein n=1 Tax=unclassified Streptomyces TaxID=2593676 RepID=UPI001F049BC2|nr:MULTISPECIES: hypothetical protein [unclassified Streptomyces]MCH0563333.1 hypothetical protein [Streptomyces sp. MUM 2J]MCH0572564.1 hypothetical protein [Streptomyces sp. MUM 136J]